MPVHTTMNERTSHALESLVGPLYLLALLLVATPLVDVLANVWPIRLGDAGWRYGAIGVTSGYVLTPLLGIALACLLATALRHRTMLRVLVVVCLAAGVVLVAAAVDFGLDAIQVSHNVPATPALARWSFNVGVAKALFKHLTAAVALAWLGLATRRASRAVSPTSEHGSTPPLVKRASTGGE